MTSCAECGEELLDESEVMLSEKKVPGTNLYYEICVVCFEEEISNGCG